MASCLTIWDKDLTFWDMAQDLIFMARAAVLEGFEATANSLNLDADALLREAGLSPDMVQDAERQIPTARIIRLLEAADAAAGHRAFGLLMAHSRPFSVLGPVALVMREQADLRGALKSLSRLGWAQVEGINLALEDDGETAMATLTIAAELPRPATQAVELAMAAIIRLQRHFLGEDWMPQMVTFSHRRPPEAGPYARLLGITPVFRMDRNSIVMLTADLDRPIVNADPALGRQLERLVEGNAQPREMLRRDQVASAIRQTLPSGRCSATAVAGLFGVDRRTLHRWLGAEATSYARLLDENRLRLCAQYLAENSRSQTEISELLGFSSLSAYSRWRRSRRSALGKARAV
jgi:AraC-like DNA-binding protein